MSVRKHGRSQLQRSSEPAPTYTKKEKQELFPLGQEKLSRLSAGLVSGPRSASSRHILPLQQHSSFSLKAPVLTALFALVDMDFSFCSISCSYQF